MQICIFKDRQAFLKTCFNLYYLKDIEKVLLPTQGGACIFVRYFVVRCLTSNNCEQTEHHRVEKTKTHGKSIFMNKS